MKILITGGAGFIGSAVIRHIITHTSHCVVNVDKLTYAANLESLAEVSGSSRYAFEQADISDRDHVERIFDTHQPDAVLHLAAESHVDRSIRGSEVFVRTNLVGTYVLLEASRGYCARLAEKRKRSFRFHHVSTDEVYGELGFNDAPFAEDHPYSPSSPYAATKAGSDHLVRAWQRTYSLPTLITNCSNNYGPYQFPEKLIPLTITNALQGRKIPIYGNGSQVRDWLFVEDHAEALIAVLERGTVGETYNIGGNNERHNIEVVNALCDILQEMVPPDITRRNSIEHYRDLITYVDDRPGHDKRYAINASRIASQLGWCPTQDFESGLRITVKWYLNNAHWWENLGNRTYERQVGELPQ